LDRKQNIPHAGDIFLFIFAGFLTILARIGGVGLSYTTIFVVIIEEHSYFTGELNLS